MHFCRRKAAEFYTEGKQRMSKTKKRILTGIILAVLLIAAGIFTYVEIRDAETIKVEEINKLPSTVLVGYLENEDRYVKLAEVNTFSKYSDKLKYKLDPNGNRIKDAEGNAFREEDPDGNELTNFYAYYSKENPGEEIRIHAVKGTPEEAAKQSGFTDAEERVDFINEELEELNGELALAEHSIKSINNKVNDYHSKTEVIMEGLADLDRNKGEVTQDNIFANTWIHRKEIEGKNPVSFGEKDVDHLAGFVVSKIAEQKTLDNFLHNPTYAKGQQNNAILVGINSGSAVDAMKKDPVFNEFLKQAQEANKRGEFY